jgi:hypothetical protein
LKRVVIEEGLLNGVQLPIWRQAFDGGDVLAASCAYLDLAASRGNAIDEYGARGALSFAAAEFGAGEIQIVAENAEERSFRIGIDPPQRAVHVEFGDSGHASILHSGVLVH